MTVRRKVLVSVCSMVVLLGCAFAWCEYEGWTFLRKPAENVLSDKLGRDVELTQRFEDDSFRLSFWGGVRLHVGRLVVANTKWGTLGPFAQVEHATLSLRYVDLFHFLTDVTHKRFC